MNRNSLSTISIIFFAFAISSGCNKISQEPGKEPTDTIKPQSPTANTSPIVLPQATTTPSPTSGLRTITIYFTDQNLFNAGTPPFEVAVTRMVPSSVDPKEAVLKAFFDGPTDEEQSQGIEAITSGFDGVSALSIEGGVARVYLTGKCESMGAAYTVAQPIMRNLLQFEDIAYVKIYDEKGTTEVTEGDTNSIPFCLEP